jgi:hypothetical protein
MHRANFTSYHLKKGVSKGHMNPQRMQHERVHIMYNRFYEADKPLLVRLCIIARKGHRLFSCNLCTNLIKWGQNTEGQRRIQVVWGLGAHMIGGFFLIVDVRSRFET